MKKTLKALTAFVLAVLVFVCTLPAAFAQEESARLKNICGNGMLFQQKKDAVLPGYAASGSLIEVLLLDDGGEPVARGKAQTNRSGEFTVSFPAPEGSFREYTVELYENGEKFETLTNVVFGELWLASGQSNMAYNLGGCDTGKVMQENGERGSKWLRVLYVPDIPEYKGSRGPVPVDPLNDINGCFWYNGESESVFATSAVAYYFAAKLMEKLEVPVGILNVPLGGSGISTWLSRDAIDSDSDVRRGITDNGTYFSAEEWNEDEADAFQQMTCNYNLKIHPLRTFRPAGIIWYQGETDLMLNTGEELYSREMALMQSSYSELFGYEDGLMPLIYTQIAAYDYGINDHDVAQFNYNFSRVTAEKPDSRAFITIYDIPLDYYDGIGAIHPAMKQPVGERMADAAEGLVYGGKTPGSAAYLLKSEVKDGCVYAAFGNVGDGLTFKGDSVKGFAVCGNDGVFVEADAEIIVPDTVRIFADSVENPVAATYAYSSVNGRSSLWSTSGGEHYMPVASFEIAVPDGAHYWTDKLWADCDGLTSWHFNGTDDAGEYGLWNGKGCELDIGQSPFEGEGCLGVKGSGGAGTAYIAPALSFRDGLGTQRYKDIDPDYTDYAELSFMVRNDGSEPAEVKGIRFYTEKLFWYSPAATQSLTVPADGQWHKLTFDLNELCISDCGCLKVNSNDVLGKVFDIRLLFNSDAQLSFDSFEFAPDKEGSADTSLKVELSASNGILDLIKAPWLFIIYKIVELVVKLK